MNLEPPLEPPADCSDEGHHWRCTGHDRDGNPHYRCARCGEESEP